jgi:hypothetical protein
MCVIRFVVIFAKDLSLDRTKYLDKPSKINRARLLLHGGGVFNVRKSRQQHQFCKQDGFVMSSLEIISDRCQTAVLKTSVS